MVGKVNRAHQYLSVERRRRFGLHWAAGGGDGQHSAEQDTKRSIDRSTTRHSFARSLNELRASVQKIEFGLFPARPETD
jgi:hypothetical protein